MNITVSGVQETLREVFETARDERPVVTVPSLPSLSSVIDVVEERPSRLVVDDSVIDTADWPTLGRLGDVSDGTNLRTASIDQTTISTRRAVGTLCSDTRPPTGVVAEPSDDVIQQFESIWRRAESREISCSTYDSVIDAVAAIGDDSAVGDVRRLCRAVRGDKSADTPVGVVVWGAAAAEPSVATLREEIPPRLGCGKRTVSRRVRQLEDAGLIQSLAVPDGSRGRPPRKLKRQADPPLTSVGREQLLSISR